MILFADIEGPDQTARTQLEHKFDHTVKKGKGHHFKTNLVDLKSRYYIPRFSLKAFLVLEKNILKCFYHIRIWRPSCSMVRNSLNKFQYHFDRSHHVTTSKNWLSSFRAEHVERLHNFIHVYIITKT